MMSHWPLSFWVNFIILLVELTWLYVLSCTICTFNVHINICFCMGFRHAHLCTNDYPYSYGFLSCTFLYERLCIIFLNGFSSCTFLYKWLSIFLCMGVRHAHFCTNDYPFHCVWVFVMHVSVRMTIHFFVHGFCLAHFCTNYYPYSYVFSSFKFLYEWLSIFFLNWFLVMYIFVRMTICSQFLSNAFLLNGNSEFLGIFSSNVSVSPCV